METPPDRTPVTDIHGDTCTFLDGQLHSFDDQPSLVTACGHNYWHRHGQTHRDGGRPAIVRSNGDLMWCVDGKLHRDNDLPAVVNSDGSHYWYTHGKPGRTGNEPAEKHPDGRKKWHDGMNEIVYQTDTGMYVDLRTNRSIQKARLL